MKRRIRLCFLAQISSLSLVLTLVVAATPLAAQPGHPGHPGHPDLPAMAAGDQGAPAEKPPVVEEKTSVTHHTATIGGQKIAYTATAGTLVLETEEGEPRASIFYVSYVRDGVDDAGRRPLTFSFNGGPGSSSVWLHLGALGPAAGQDDRRGRGAAAALRPRGEPPLDPRRHRPGVHRSGVDRLLPPRPRRRRPGVPRRRGGHPIRRCLHPPLALRQRPLGEPQVPDRRELRHDPGGQPGRRAPGPPRRLLQRRHAGLLDPQLRDRPLRRRQRPALPAVPADLYRHRLVPRQAAGRVRRRPAQGARRRRGVRHGGLHPGADEGRAPCRRRSATRWPSAWRG